MSAASDYTRARDVQFHEKDTKQFCDFQWTCRPSEDFFTGWRSSIGWRGCSSTVRGYAGDEGKAEIHLASHWYRRTVSPGYDWIGAHVQQIFLAAADQTIIVACYGKIGSDLEALNNTSWIATG